MRGLFRLIISLTTTLCCVGVAWSSVGKPNEGAALDVLRRVVGKQANSSVKFKIEALPDNHSYFKYDVTGGILHVTANSPVSLCRGVYDYMKSEQMGIYSWSGSSLRLDDKLENGVSKKVVSPFDHHYYFNVVTYGYTMPYWDWERWQQEIDWMAMHGIDMPLALVAYEAIISRVWQKMGLSPDEINRYFGSPAHLPWNRMGNISGVGQPLNDDWHKDQVALQHKILSRMRELGMTPICPGFAGFVPEGMKDHYPEVDLVKTNWGGAFNNWMISAQDDLFTKIGSEFVREWEKEFGKCSHYLVDSFNEMEIPFPEKGSQERYRLVASYGEKVYNSIKQANADAVWTMQGWMFGYQRHIWDYQTLEALVSKVPDDKMLLLDLAVDYNKHFWHSEVNWEFYKGFYNKPWVYSTIPNMGGKTGMTGVLDFYANGHLQALESNNGGRLVGYGTAPEGIENNEVVYELICDAGWSSDSIDVKEWLKNYSVNRYGGYPDMIDNYWNGLLASVYGTFTDHPRYNWQFRPGLVAKGSININEELLKAIENFIMVAPQMGDSNKLYKVDLAEQTALYLGAKAEILIRAIDRMYLIGDTLQAARYEDLFAQTLIGVDRLLDTHPILRLERWLDFAAGHATNSEQRQAYRSNARRIVTVWGPPVDDYSARIWSGLIRDYYLPRWQNYFESRKSGYPFDFASWEADWVKCDSLSKIEKVEDVAQFARDMVAKLETITLELDKDYNDKVIGRWSVDSPKGHEVTLALKSEQLKRLKALEFVMTKGEQATLIEVQIVADGITIMDSKDVGAQLTSTDNRYSLDVQLADNYTSNNSCELKVTISSKAASGVIIGLEAR